MFLDHNWLCHQHTLLRMQLRSYVVSLPMMLQVSCVAVKNNWTEYRSSGNSIDNRLIRVDLESGFCQEIDFTVISHFYTLSLIFFGQF